MSRITVKEKQQLLKELAKGYEKMADINTELAEQGTAADSEALSVCEDSLTESE